MKKKLILIIALIAFSILIFTACSQPKQDLPKTEDPSQQNTSQEKNTEQPKKDAEMEQKENNPPTTSAEQPIKGGGVEQKDFLKKFEEANKNLKSVCLTLHGDYDFFGTKSVIKMDELLEYDIQTLDIIAFYTTFSVEKIGEQILRSEVVYQKPGEVYFRDNDGEWQQDILEQDRIDYHGFVNVLKKILTNENVVITKSPDGYEVLLTDRNFDLINTFKGELDYSLSGIDQKEVDKKVLFKIDGKTLFINEISVDMKYESSGVLQIDTLSLVKMSDHNNIKRDEITKVYESVKP